ncbi:serine hydrolase [Streptomyces sp. NPDC008121]|uniref:serine hydrolase domain-containing protein n=1 Tax=Streptomyces sp. NPDC008121 TaxID=3364809 RepID=UPI0036EBE0D5
MALGENAPPGPAGPAAPPAEVSDAMLRSFDEDVRKAMAAFSMVGAAVAVVQGNKVIYNRGFGFRNQEKKQPVTPRTSFRVGSNTKSMTSLLMAQYADEGRLKWDTHITDLWPEFRAPTPRLTESLRVADMFSMASGIGESPTIEFFMSGGGVDPLDAMRSVAYLPVISAPNKKYYYNNTLVATAIHASLTAEGTKPDALADAYEAEIQKRVLAPIGMTDSGVGADLRVLTSDYADGYEIDLSGKAGQVPFISIDGIDPAGGAFSSSTDMARYVITQMNEGVTPEGKRVASRANVARTHKPGIAVPPDVSGGLPSAVLGDTKSLHYCMGWFRQKFNDGRELVWHSGGIDGFGTTMGFFPREKTGFVVLTNLDPAASGRFTLSVQSSLMSRLFGLNADVPAALASTAPQAREKRKKAAAETRPADRTAQKYLGLYSQGFTLDSPESGQLVLRHDIRSFPVRRISGDTYLITGGPSVVLGKKVTFKKGANSMPVMTIEGFEPARWLTGGF